VSIVGTYRFPCLLPWLKRFWWFLGFMGHFLHVTVLEEDLVLDFLLGFWLELEESVR